MLNETLNFEFNPEQRSIIKVIGVGGGGSNAVNHMFRQGIKGVEFVICNTDFQDLQKSPVSNKIQLGLNLTRGLGAGSLPEKGREAAIETIDEIRRQLSDGTQMVFITAGLGGGTGTGAAPVIASIAKELGILTVAIVTIPFTIEGKKRRAQAEQGLEELKKYVDTLLVIGNDKLREIYGNLKMGEAFTHADNVLLSAAKAIAEIISINLHINVDFNDVKTVMKESGVAIMGSASASGEHRALRAVENALNSPLLNDNNIKGARHVLLNIMSGSDDITMDEFGEITDYLQEESGYTAELITGYGIDESLGDQVSVTIIATGFSQKNTGYEPVQQNERIINHLHDEVQVKTEQVTIKKEEVVEQDINEPFLLQPSSSEEKNEIQSSPSNLEINFSDAFSNHEESKENAFETEISNLNFEQEQIQEKNDSNDFEFIVKESEINPSPAEELNFTFSITNNSSEENLSTSLDNNLNNETVNFKSQEELNKEERIRFAQERIRRLKELSLKIKTPEGLNQMEREPTFRRKNTQLEDTNYSKESSVSRYTLSDGDGKTEIKPNNSFLHDNVD
ncbi:MAG: cell division protein FtsZ [Bacteroidota bacterium]|jgi:cell division protein FtsZ